MTLSFDALRDANLTRLRHWHTEDDGWSLADWSNAMCGEAGEAANIVKKIRRHETGQPGKHDPHPAILYRSLADELADVVIYLDLLAAKAGIDLGEAVALKFDAVSHREGIPVFLYAEDES